MKKNKIGIQVSGIYNSGKSTIITLIRNTLQKEGFDIVLEPYTTPDGEFLEDIVVSDEILVRNIDSIKEKSTIVLSETNLCRIPNTKN